MIRKKVLWYLTLFHHFAGTMLEGAMAIGEISPGNQTRDWIWVPRVKKGRKLATRKMGVKNKFINHCMKVRVISLMS